MADSTAPGRRRSDVFSWTLRILLASLFLYQGIDKFSERRLWLRLFDEIGFGQWFRYFTGVVEISGALMLLVPRATLVGVGLLVCTMIGALLVHASVIGLSPQTVFVAVLLVLLCAIGVRHIRRKKRTNSQTVSRALWVASLLTSLACGSSVDSSKFQNVSAIASALRADLNDSGADGSPQFDGLLKRFRLDISALEERISGRRENAVLDAYRRAYENYQYFLRFKLLEPEAVGGMVLLSGRNRPIASRSELPIENRGGGRWVNRKEAMKVFSDQAEREIATAANLLSGN